jgi:signal recognition particle receptor subunit beta
MFPNLYRITVVGDGRAGKTTFLSKVCDNFTPMERKSTRDSHMISKGDTISVSAEMGDKKIKYDNKDITLSFKTIPGQEHMKVVRFALKDYLGKCDLGILLVDSAKQSSYNPDLTIMNEVLGIGDYELAIIANKQDLEGAIKPEEVKKLLLNTPSELDSSIEEKLRKAEVYGCVATDKEIACQTLDSIMKDYLPRIVA